jgi:hypothetical protein
MQVATACGIWCFGFQVVSMVWSWGLCVRFAAANRTHNPHLCNTLELLMMGIVVAETCWASNKICNKNHLLHLVGILFPLVCSVSIRLCFFSDNSCIHNRCIFCNFRQKLSTHSTDHWRWVSQQEVLSFLFVPPVLSGSGTLHAHVRHIHQCKLSNHLYSFNNTERTVWLPAV